MPGTYIILKIKKDSLVTECMDLLEDLKRNPMVSCTTLNVKLEKPIKEQSTALKNKAIYH